MESKWAVYDTSKFPIVNVKMKRNIETDRQFDQFLEEWLELYEKKVNFVMNFDATDVGYVSIK